MFTTFSIGYFIFPNKMRLHPRQFDTNQSKSSNGLQRLSAPVSFVMTARVIGVFLSNTSVRFVFKFHVTHLIGQVLSIYFPVYCILFGFHSAKAVSFIPLCESITLEKFSIFPHLRLNFVADYFQCELVQIEKCHKNSNY